jgi:hypothetical protein
VGRGLFGIPIHTDQTHPSFQSISFFSHLDKYTHSQLDQISYKTNNTPSELLYHLRCKLYRHSKSILYIIAANYRNIPRQQLKKINKVYDQGPLVIHTLHEEQQIKVWRRAGHANIGSKTIEKFEINHCFSAISGSPKEACAGQCPIYMNNRVQYIAQFSQIIFTLGQIKLGKYH